MAAHAPPAAPAASLQGQHALVTGAARGIGAAIARMLAAEGATLTLLGRDARSLQALCDALPVALQDVGQAGHGIVLADVADEAQVQAAFAQARAARGVVRILINNAGQVETAPLQATSQALWQRMLAVNLSGCFLCTRAALPDMLAARQGRIVQIASTAAQRGYAYVSAYAAAKHGVLGLTRSLALEVAARGITVNAVCPGYTETDLLLGSLTQVAERSGRSTQQVRELMVASNPQRRLVQPQEVADAVRWLCGEAAASINGQAISVCGGEVM